MTENDPATPAPEQIVEEPQETVGASGEQQEQQQEQQGQQRQQQQEQEEEEEEEEWHTPNSFGGSADNVEQFEYDDGSTPAVRTQSYSSVLLTSVLDRPDGIPARPRPRPDPVHRIVQAILRDPFARTVGIFTIIGSVFGTMGAMFAALGYYRSKRLDEGRE